MRNVLIAAFVGLIAACGGKQETGSDQPTSMPVEEVVVAPASVRVIHASTATPLRVAAGDMQLTPDAVQPGGWSDRFVAPAGQHTLTFGPAGGGEAFATADVDFAPAGAYSLILIGDHTSVIRADMPTVLVLEDDLTAPPAGEARVRFVHAALGVGEVSLSDGQGRGYAAGLGYGGASGWYSVTPGDNTVDIAVGGDIVASIPAPFTAGFTTTVVITQGGDGVEAAFVHDSVN